MSLTNNITIASYDHNAKSYVEHTPQHYPKYREKMLTWLDTLAELAPTDGKIFEIGSATTRDAQYFRKHGLKVQCSDASDELLKLLVEQGESPIKFNFLTDDMGGDYQLLFANGVFPHFSPEEVRLTLEKSFNYLPKDGLLAMNVKKGEGESWVHEKFYEGRFTHYWQLSDIVEMVKSVGFNPVFIKDDCLGDLPNHVWVNIILQK